MIDDLIANGQTIMKMIFSAWNLLLISLVWIGLHVAQERFSELFEKPKVGWRLLPYLPSFVCVPLTFVDGPWFPVEVHPTASMRVMLGLALGFAAFNFGGALNRAGAAGILNKLGVDWLVTKTGGGKDEVAENQQIPPKP